MTPDERRLFLDSRRRINAERMDELFAPIYDDDWGGYVNPTHAGFVAELIELAHDQADRPKLLDAACGTGKYWSTLLSAGCSVVGVDHSAGMLAKAHAKYPDVPFRQLALQDLAGQPDLAAGFDGVLCVDAMENVGPEDWPVALDGLGSTLRKGAPMYLTVELPESGLASDDPEAPLVEGEVLAGGAYHYFPDRPRVEGWLADAGLNLRRWAEGDGYAHLLCEARQS